MSQTSLWIKSRTSIDLAQASGAFTRVFSPNTPVPALLYAPDKCRFALCENGLFRGPHGETINVDRVYEARIFNDRAELRWLNDPTPQGNHRAVILVDEDVSKQLADWQMRRQPIRRTLPQTYLLWGQGTGSANGNWSRLSTARIGTLDVPLPGVPSQANVLLHSIEYLVEREHGNVVVFDERLIGLSIA